VEYAAVRLVEGDWTFLNFPQHSWSQSMRMHCILGSKYNNLWFSMGVPAASGQIATALLVLGPKEQTYATLKVLKCN